MATERMTVVKAIDTALSYIPADETAVIDKLNHMKEQAMKKSNTPRKPSAKQAENDAIREEIMSFLREVNAPKRISEICEGVPALHDASSQKVSGLLRPLILI